MKAQLMKYNAAAQHLGTWLLGYDSNVYGCGTYREPVSEVRAQALMKRFIERLAHELRTPVSYYAALERRYSGCGHSPVPVHWHFLAASAKPAGMADVAKRLWRKLFGHAKVKLYDSSLNGTYYASKLAPHQNCTILDGGMERLNYNGPTDLIAAAHANRYVPDHLKDKVFGQFLRVRPLKSDLAIEEPYKPRRDGFAAITKQIGIQRGNWNSKNVELLPPEIQSEPKITPAPLKAACSRQLRISSPSAPPRIPRPASQHAAGHGVLWEFRNTELHKPVWIPLSH